MWCVDGSPPFLRGNVFAFSPTDTMVSIAASAAGVAADQTSAGALMAAQSSIVLVTIGLVIARAVNVLK